MMQNVLAMLLGAAFVALGILAAALADRIRGICVPREMPRERSTRTSAVLPYTPSFPAMKVVSEMPRPARSPRVPRAEPKATGSTDGGDDVIAALVAAGYKKAIATEATWACGAGERASIEGWTASALRRCARGGMS